MFLLQAAISLLDLVFLLFFPSFSIHFLALALRALASDLQQEHDHGHVPGSGGDVQRPQRASGAAHAAPARQGQSPGQRPARHAHCAPHHLHHAHQHLAHPLHCSFPPGFSRHLFSSRSSFFPSQFLLPFFSRRFSTFLDLTSVFCDERIIFFLSLVSLSRLLCSPHFSHKCLLYPVFPIAFFFPRYFFILFCYFAVACHFFSPFSLNPFFSPISSTFQLTLQRPLFTYIIFLHPRRFCCAVRFAAEKKKANLGALHPSFWLFFFFFIPREMHICRHFCTRMHVPTFPRARHCLKAAFVCLSRGWGARVVWVSFSLSVSCLFWCSRGRCVCLDQGFPNLGTDAPVICPLFFLRALNSQIFHR